MNKEVCAALLHILDSEILSKAQKLEIIRDYIETVQDSLND